MDMDNQSYIIPLGTVESRIDPNKSASEIVESLLETVDMSIVAGDTLVYKGDTHTISKVTPEIDGAVITTDKGKTFWWDHEYGWKDRKDGNDLNDEIDY